MMCLIVGQFSKVRKSAEACLLIFRACVYVCSETLKGYNMSKQDDPSIREGARTLNFEWSEDSFMIEESTRIRAEVT